MHRERYILLPKVNFFPLKEIWWRLYFLRKIVHWLFLPTSYKNPGQGTIWFCGLVAGTVDSVKTAVLEKKYMIEDVSAHRLYITKHLGTCTLAPDDSYLL